MATSSDTGVKIHKKRAEKLGVPNLTEILSGVPFRDLIPIFVQAWRNRAANRKASDLLSDYVAKRRFYGVSEFDQRILHQFVTEFYAVLPDYFQVVELSPIAPLGVNSVITRVSQDVSLPTIRGSEVVSDPTTVLALECAVQRQQLRNHDLTRGTVVNLATTQRVLRLQPFDATRGYMQHFRGLGLCSGGRSDSRSGFINEALTSHISIWLGLVKRLQEMGYEFGEQTVRISDTRVLDQLIDALSLSRAEINANSTNDDFDLFEAYGISLPRQLDLSEVASSSAWDSYGLRKRLPYLESLDQLIASSLRERYPGARLCFDLTRKCGIGYYDGICYTVTALNSAGRSVQLADGGTVDWLAQLTTDQREQMFTSGFGVELTHKLFRAS